MHRPELRIFSRKPENIWDWPLVALCLNLTVFYPKDMAIGNRFGECHYWRSSQSAIERVLPAQKTIGSAWWYQDTFWCLFLIFEDPNLVEALFVQYVQTPHEFPNWKSAPWTIVGSLFLLSVKSEWILVPFSVRACTLDRSLQQKFKTIRNPMDDKALVPPLSKPWAFTCPQIQYCGNWRHAG